MLRAVRPTDHRLVQYGLPGARPLWRQGFGEPGEGRREGGAKPRKKRKVIVQELHV